MPTGQITQFDFNQKPPDEERSPEFWRALAREELFKNIWQQDLNVKKAKNMILFLGDGMSLSTVAAARILKRQKINHTGEEEALSFVSNRLHESDADVLEFGQYSATCMDIAQQLVLQEPGQNFNVIMGGVINLMTMETLGGVRMAET